MKKTLKNSPKAQNVTSGEAKFSLQAAHLENLQFLCGSRNCTQGDRGMDCLLVKLGL